MPRSLPLAMALAVALSINVPSRVHAAEGTPSGGGSNRESETAPKAETGSGWRRPVGLTALGLGMAATVAGTVLTAIHGDLVDCHEGVALTEVCDRVLDTALTGWLTIGTGMAAIAGALYLLFTDRRPEQTHGVAIIPQGTGLALHGRF